MKNLALFFIILGLVFLVMPFIAASSQPVQQYNKIYLNPFYRGGLISGVANDYSFMFSPPDKVGEVLSALITFDVYYSPSVNFTLLVNNQKCNTPSYYISTTYATASQGRITFDCTNVITSSKVYNVSIKTSKDTGAINGWVDLTYMNDPIGTLRMGGTEYTYGQTALEWVQVVDANNSIINNAVCYIAIYTPLGTILINNALMTNANANGLYTYSLAVPIIAGVYPVLATCYYTATSDKRNVTSYLLTTGTVNTQTIINNTWILDGIYLSLKTDGGAGNNRMNATFNFSDYYANCGNVSEALMTGFTVYWSGVWNTVNLNHDIQPYVYNHSSSSWITLNNKILGGSGTGTMTVTNSLSTTNITKLLGLTSSKPLLIKFADNSNSEGTKDWKTDYLYASCDQLGFPSPQIVRGASEMHITSGFEYQSLPGTMNVSNSITITLSNGTNITESYYTGIFLSRFSVQSGSASVPVIPATITVYPYGGLDCDSILSLYIITNGTLYTPVTGFKSWNTASGQCALTFSTNVSTGSTSYFEVHARNHWESMIRDYNTMIGSVYPLIDAGCKLWQISNGLPNYITPKNQTNTGYDYYYRACANWYDDYYWFNISYYETLTDKALITGSSDSQDYFLAYEGDFFSAFEYGKILDMMTQSLIANLGATNDFSALLIANPLGDDIVNTTNQRYWSSVSTAYLNWKMLNASCGSGVCKINGSDVWNFTNRTLTELNMNVTVTATINSTEISNAVWSYNGTVSSSLLSQFANSVWVLFNSTYNFISLISASVWEKDIVLEVWNFENRSLTTGTGIVGGTEYTSDAVSGRIVARILDGGANPVLSAICNLTIYYPNFPNNLTAKYSTLMLGGGNISGGGQGVYYFDWDNNTANGDLFGQSGVYTYAVDCTKSGQKYWLLGTYHIQNVGVEATAEAVWNFMNRSLTEITEVNYTLIANLVWTNINRSLTEFNFTVEINNSAIVDAIWNAVNRTLSNYNQSDLTDYDKIQVMVWNATIRTLTDFNITVNALVNDSAIANAVWSYTNKTVDFATTGSTDNVSLVENIRNMGHTYVGNTEYIQGTDGKVAIRLVRGTGDLAVVETGAECYISITYPNASYIVNMTTMTELGDGVYYYNFIVPSVVGVYPYYTNCNITTRKYFSLDTFHVYEDNYTGIPKAIWDYSSGRNLTYYETNNLTATDVWSAPARELTYYPIANVTNLSVIVDSNSIANAVWAYNGTVSNNILTQIVSKSSCVVQQLLSELDSEKWGVNINSC